MSATVIAFLILVGLLILSIVFIFFQHKGLVKEFELLKETEKIKEKNEEEANEKIDDLHNGKLSADDILPKR